MIITDRGTPAQIDCIIHPVQCLCNKHASVNLVITSRSQYNFNINYITLSNRKIYKLHQKEFKKIIFPN